MAESPVPAKRRWTLSQEAFDTLLARLDPDRDRAGEAYEKIRYKLTRVFDFGRASDPEELFDETMDRVAKRILEGVEIPSSDPFPFIRGVALRVLQEDRRRRRQAQQFEPPPPPPPPPPENVLRCLDESKKRLIPEERELIELYYEGDSLKKTRKEAAEKFHRSPNALRIWASRVRHKLGGYIKECLKRREEMK